MPHILHLHGVVCSAYPAWRRSTRMLIHTRIFWQVTYHIENCLLHYTASSKLNDINGMTRIVFKWSLAGMHGAWQDVRYTRRVCQEMAAYPWKLNWPQFYCVQWDRKGFAYVTTVMNAESKVPPNHAVFCFVLANTLATPYYVSSYLGT
jgi:hypothetical protein